MRQGKCIPKFAQEWFHGKKLENAQGNKFGLSQGAAYSKQERKSSRFTSARTFHVTRDEALVKLTRCTMNNVFLVLFPEQLNTPCYVGSPIPAEYIPNVRLTYGKGH